MEHGEHYRPKVLKKLVHVKEDLNSEKVYPDKLEILRDENKHLKMDQNAMEEHVRVIAAKLRRQIHML